MPFRVAAVNSSGSRISNVCSVNANARMEHPLSVRERLRPTDDELYLVFRTLVADDSDVSPGWFWLSDYSDRAIIVRLLRVIHYDDNAGARARGFSVLRVAAVPLFQQFRDSFLRQTVPDLPAAVHDEAWADLVDVATAEDVDILGDSAGTWLESRVGWLRAWLDSGRDFDQFLPKSPDPQFFPEHMKRLMAERIPRLSDASLAALSNMPMADLSEEAAAELGRRGLPSGAAKDAPHLRRRRVTLASLLASRPPVGGGTEPRETDDNRYERLSRQSSDELRAALDWYTVDGDVSYQLLAERGEISKETVRADLNSQFQRVRESSDELLEKGYGAAAAAKLKQQFANLNDFIAQQFSEKAMAVLASDSTWEDVPIARKLLSNDGTRSSALEIIASNGDSSDVEQLLEIGRTSFGDDRSTALRGIRRLTSDKLATAKVLITGEGRELRRAGLALVRDVEDPDALRFLHELMSHDDEEVRVVAVGLVRSRLDQAQLLEFLRAYIAKGTYYYNVVTWVDRLLYAPEPMSGYYASELDSKLKQVTDNV